jgi:hypothetical protein
VADIAKREFLLEKVIDIGDIRAHVPGDEIFDRLATVSAIDGRRSVINVGRKEVGILKSSSKLMGFKEFFSRDGCATGECAFNLERKLGSGESLSERRLFGNLLRLWAAGIRKTVELASLSMCLSSSAFSFGFLVRFAIFKRCNTHATPFLKLSDCLLKTKNLALASDEVLIFLLVQKLRERLAAIDEVPLFLRKLLLQSDFLAVVKKIMFEDHTLAFGTLVQTIVVDSENVMLKHVFWFKFTCHRVDAITRFEAHSLHNFFCFICILCLKLQATGHVSLNFMTSWNTGSRLLLRTSRRSSSSLVCFLGCCNTSFAVCLELFLRDRVGQGHIIGICEFRKREVLAVDVGVFIVLLAFILSTERTDVGSNVSPGPDPILLRALNETKFLISTPILGEDRAGIGLDNEIAMSRGIVIFVALRVGEVARDA